MWCPTKKLITYVQTEYIARYKSLEGVRYLRKTLHKDSKYQRTLAHLEGQLYHLRHQEIIGILENQLPVRQANDRLMEFLYQLRENESYYIYVYKKSKLNEKISGIVEGNNPSIYPGSLRKIKKRSTINFRFFFSRFKKIFLIIGIVGLIYLYLSSEKTTLSPLDQVTSWNNENSDLWAIHLRSFKDLINAKREVDAFRSRDISIVNLNDGRFYLFIFHDSKESAESEFSRRIKNRWKKSRIIPIDLCKPLLDVSAGFYLCK